MSLLDVLLLGVRRVFYGGVTLPQEPTLAFVGSGVTVADSPTTQQTVVTITGAGSSIPVAFGSISATQNLPSPASNAKYVVTPSAAVTVTVTGTPVDGVELTFWGYWSPTNPFTFASQAGGTVQDPANIGGTPGGSATMVLSGGSVTFKWSAAALKWASI